MPHYFLIHQQAAAKFPINKYMFTPNQHNETVQQLNFPSTTSTFDPRMKTRKPNYTDLSKEKTEIDMLTCNIHATYIATGTTNM